MTDQANPQNSAPQPANHESLSDDGDETVILARGSDLDELSNSDPADAPDIADRLASVLADRLEAGGLTQGGGD